MLRVESSDYPATYIVCATCHARRPIGEKLICKPEKLNETSPSGGTYKKPLHCPRVDSAVVRVYSTLRQQLNSTK